MEIKNNEEKMIKIPGRENINIKLADNTGKKPETYKRIILSKKIPNYKKLFYKTNYSRIKIIPSNMYRQIFSYERKRRHGLWNRRRGRIKIIIRNLSRDATNRDIKTIFEKIGPLIRCGIKWNNIGCSKDIAEVEYLFNSDAFRAYKKLDYKSIKGVPIRLEMKISNRMRFFRINSPYILSRRFWYRNYYNRLSSRMYAKNFYHLRNIFRKRY